jgi:hypothetical protein
MILGMSIATFTLVHVIISQVAIFAGAVVITGMFSSSFRSCSWGWRFSRSTSASRP